MTNADLDRVISVIRSSRCADLSAWWVTAIDEHVGHFFDNEELPVGFLRITYKNPKVTT
jgi:hypothetical protein